MKSPQEIQELKTQWEKDPCWDIETTPSFEAHEAELREYRIRREGEWESERKTREEDTLRAAAHRFGTSGNDALTRHLLAQEKSLADAQGQIEQLQAQIDQANSDISTLQGEIRHLERGIESLHSR